MSEEKKVVKQEKVNNLEVAKASDVVKTDDKALVNNSILDNIKTYKKYSDLTREEVESLDKAVITLEKVINKKNNSEKYTLTITLKNGMKFNKFIHKNQYMMIIMKRNLNPNILINHFPTPIRFIKGDWNSLLPGEYWVKYEVFISFGYTVSDFLNKDDKYCVELLGDKFGYIMIDSPDKFDYLDDVSYDDAFLR